MGAISHLKHTAGASSGLLFLEVTPKGFRETLRVTRLVPTPRAPCLRAYSLSVTGGQLPVRGMCACKGPTQPCTVGTQLRLPKEEPQPRLIGVWWFYTPHTATFYVGDTAPHCFSRKSVPTLLSPCGGRGGWLGSGCHDSPG